MRLLTSGLVFLRLPILFCFFVMGTHVHASMPSPAELVKDVPVEVIEVTGYRPIGHYRKLVREAEEQFYDSYNQLTKVEDFKVTCEMQRRTFSRIKERRCVAGFVDAMMARSNEIGIESSSSRGGLANLPSRLDLDQSLAKRRQAQIADAYKALVESEELRKVFAQLIQAREAYQSRKQQQFGERLVANMDTDALVPELKRDRPAGR